MLYSLALAVLTIAPAQGGMVKLTNIRMTIGELGPTRPTSKLLPGDILFIGYDVNGVTIAPDGVAVYTMAMEVVNSAGKTIFKQDAREMKDFVPLRGNTFPARAFVTIGIDQDAGAYTCKVTVEDPKTKSKDTLSTKFEVLKQDFGIVAVYATHDLGGALAAPTTGIVGQTTFIQFSVASFQRDIKTKQPNVEFEFQILDDKGTPTLAQPGKAIQDDKSLEKVNENAGAFAMKYALFLSRPGKFTFKITATDKLASKTYNYELPVTILPAN